MTIQKTKPAELILSIDAGTQSIRAALVDLGGTIRQIVKTPIEPYFSSHPGWAEQRPEYYWEMLCKSCLALFEGSTEPKESILGVTLTTQRATVINVDERGEPLRPAIVWLDQRKAERAGLVPGLMKACSKASRTIKMLAGVLEDCEATWIRQNQPEVWEKTHKHLLLSGYFTYKLTGEFVDSTGNMVGYIPFDVKKSQWAGDHDLKWRLFPIEKEKLPGLVKPAELLGAITAKAADETGIPEGLPVIAAANDKACEILGAGCITPADACISFGTIATVNVQSDKYIELRPLWPPYPSAVPDQFYTEVAVMRGAWMITWFKEEFGLQERLEAAEKGLPPEVLMDRMVRDVPPIASGLVVQPYWTPSLEKSSCSRGSVIGFCDVHKRAHLYRAILEGLVFALKEGAELSEKKNRTQIREIHVSGGGSQSDSIMQITADIFGIPARRPHTHETSALGAAIDAAVGLKLFPDFAAATKEMARTGEIFEPIDGNVEIYRKFYERVYLKIYKRLLPLFREMREITGYPE